MEYPRNYLDNCVLDQKLKKKKKKPTDSADIPNAFELRYCELYEHC